MLTLFCGFGNGDVKCAIFVVVAICGVVMVIGMVTFVNVQTGVSERNVVECGQMNVNVAIAIVVMKLQQ